jgi:hypothetical protein
MRLFRWRRLLGALALSAAGSAALAQSAAPALPPAMASPPAAPAPLDGQAMPLLVKGAWSSASDASTPVPEAGAYREGAYHNEYLGLTYPLPEGWAEKYQGPPPSDSGYYVLAQISPTERYARTRRGTLLIVARDLFFTPLSAGNALQLVKDARDHLSGDYQIEHPPAEVRIGGRAFVRFGYGSPATGLHWYILATEVRCHIVEFIYTSRSTALIENLVRDFSRVVFSPRTAGDDVPVCLQDYASAQNVLERVEPVLLEHRFHPIPVRVIIDKEGRVRHIHFLSAFPSEAQAITEALFRWRFQPYVRDGRPVDVETGILFGRASAAPSH